MTQRNSRIEKYEESPLVIQRAIRDFQTGRSVACIAWNPHRGRECELAVGFSYWVGGGIVFALSFIQSIVIELLFTTISPSVIII